MAIFEEIQALLLAESVDYLDHMIGSFSMVGTPPYQSYILAMQNTPVPQNITQLKSILRLNNYYSPKLLSLLAPLNKLSQKGTKLHCTETQQTLFDKTKSLLQTSVVLAHAFHKVSVSMQHFSLWSQGCVVPIPRWWCRKTCGFCIKIFAERWTILTLKKKAWQWFSASNIFTNTYMVTISLFCLSPTIETTFQWNKGSISNGIWTYTEVGSHPEHIQVWTKIQER